MLVILDTQKAEIRRIEIPSTQTGLVELLKC
jgi:hypothetical protein